MRIATLFIPILLLGACAGAEEDGADNSSGSSDAAAEADAASDTPPTSMAAAATGTTDAEPESEDEILPMSETGWRVIGEDGAVYTTFLDADGTYRDFKNGDAWQEGEWERREDGRLCFTPADEERVGECWTHDKLENDGTMRSTSDADRTVELRRVTYIAPATTDRGM